jgi:phosphatidylinositol alpha-mannosyltransferase
MKALVYPHSTGIGGSQLNAVEISALVRDRGHEILMVSRPGPLVETMRQLDLPHVCLDDRAVRRPSAVAIGQLAELARKHRCDVVHGYEWPPGLEAFAGGRLRLGLPAVCTVMSMVVAPFLPRTMPLIVGTDQIRRQALQAGHQKVTLLEWPVDVRANAPGQDPGSFRRDLGLKPDVPLVVIVGRLATELKLEGLLAACDAAGEVASTGTCMQLVLVGEGQARPLVEAAAQAANTRAGYRVVTLAGLMTDPRRAYAAADIVVGMGGSALRGMAFAKPVVVQGEHGFCELLTPQSAQLFSGPGWYGLGPPEHGRAQAAARLAAILRDLAPDPARRASLGQFARSLAVSRYSLERAAQVQIEAYAEAITQCSDTSRLELAADATRAAASLAYYKTHRKWQRLRGTAAVDDFNTVARMRPQFQHAQPQPAQPQQA